MGLSMKEIFMAVSPAAMESITTPVPLPHAHGQGKLKGPDGSSLEGTFENGLVLLPARKLMGSLLIFFHHSFKALLPLLIQVANREQSCFGTGCRKRLGDKKWKSQGKAIWPPR
jgi:hypothetical protein